MRSEIMEGVYMSFQCCSKIQTSALTINGRIDQEKLYISLCCETIPTIPRIDYKETPEDTLRAFMGESALLFAECARSPEDSQRHFSAGCVRCAQFRQGDYNTNGLIQYINLSMYPAPCQCRCIYCSVYKQDQSITSDAARTAYEKVFDLLDLAVSSGVVDPNAMWQVSSGEITIHPYRDRIMRLVRGKRTTFYTNCMKFDEDIAQTLHDNSKSAINLSIDAGTSETWKQVKGIDNFDRVTENLTRYYKQSARPGQIALKYIILPGINDSHEDYQSLIKIMEALEVKRLSLSRDVLKKYTMSREEQIELTGAASRLLAMCRKNGITYDMYPYTKAEQDEALRLAEELLR